MKRLLAVVMSLMMLVSLAACGAEETEAPAATEAATEAGAVDAVTAASIVDNAEDLIVAVSADGGWIAATLNDITVDQDLVVEGEFISKEKIDRKLALYTQDEDHNITGQFTVTAPKLIVKSENFRLTGGTFKGDVYVEAPGFKLDKSSTVDGNIFFASKELLDTFIVSDTSEVTGTIQVDSVDVVSSASLVTDADGLVNALSADGTWIVATYFNMVLKSDLVVDGVFYNKDDTTKDLYRKLALYTQDADHNITASFSLTAPSMVVKSENFKIQGGTFVGDVYVEAPGFTISHGTVDGNVYFASQELMDSMVADETGVVTGVKEVKAK